jgi:hypothetical protein
MARDKKKLTRSLRAFRLAFPLLLGVVERALLELELLELLVLPLGAFVSFVSFSSTSSIP